MAAKCKGVIVRGSLYFFYKLFIFQLKVRCFLYAFKNGFMVLVVFIVNVFVSYHITLNLVVNKLT